MSERVIKKVTLGVTGQCRKVLSWCLCPRPHQAWVCRAAQAGLGTYPYGHAADEAELDHNPFPSYHQQLPLHETPVPGYHPVYRPPAIPPSPSSPSSHLHQLWNSTVHYKRNFEKSKVSLRLFNSDYNGARGSTCPGFLLQIERLCIRARRLLPEILLCNFSPHESPDL